MYVCMYVCISVPNVCVYVCMWEIMLMYVRIYKCMCAVSDMI